MTDIYINLISYLLSCLSILKMNINVIMTVIKLLLFFLNSVVKCFILKYPPPQSFIDRTGRFFDLQ